MFELTSWPEERIVPTQVAAFVILYSLAIVALLYLTPQRIVGLAVLHFATGGLGISLGFHRLLTHRSFKTSIAVETVLAFLGTLVLTTAF